LMFPGIYCFQERICTFRPIYTIRFVVYDSDPGEYIWDRINARTNVRLQISPSTNEHKLWHQHSLSYVRMTIVHVYDKSYRVDRTFMVIAQSPKLFSFIFLRVM
jgi:hypothetical protein